MSLILPDSNIWISWLLGDAGHARFDGPFVSGSIIVPAIVVYEVTRWFLANDGSETAELASRQLQRGTHVAIDAAMAAAAAVLAARHRLAMADAMILSCARAHDAELWTQDADFAGLPSVRLFDRL